MSKTVEEVVRIPLSKLVPHPDNPRKAAAFGKTKLKPLADALDMNGVAPLVVRELEGEKGKFQVLAGHRRLAALEVGGEKDAPCVVRQFDDTQALRFLLADNVLHEDADPFLEARVIKKLLNEPGSTLESTAKALGWSVRTVARRRELLNLCPTILQERQRADSAIALWPTTWLEAVVQLDPVVQEKWFAESAPDRFMTIDEVEGSIGDYLRVLGDAKWDLDDAALVPKAGACSACPKQSSFTPGLFGNEGGKLQTATCRDAVCWKSKLDKFTTRAVQTALEKNPDLVVLKGAIQYSNYDPAAKYDSASARLPKGTETIGAGGWKPCAKDDKGAKEGIIGSGPAAGKRQWFKKDNRSGGYQPGYQTPARDPSAKEKLKNAEAELEMRRAAQFAGDTAKVLRDKTVDKVPDFRDVLAIAAVCGITRSEWKHVERDWDEAVTNSHAGAQQFADYIWPGVREEAARMLEQAWQATTAQRRSLCRHILTVVQDDVVAQTIEAEADKAIEEPKELLALREAAAKKPGKGKKPKHEPNAKGTDIAADDVDDEAGE